MKDTDNIDKLNQSDKEQIWSYSSPCTFSNVVHLKNVP